MKWQTTKILLFTWHFTLAVLKKRNKSIVKGSPPDGGPLKKTQDVTHITMWRRWPTAKTAQTPSIDTHRVHGKWTSLIGKTNRQIYFDNCNQHNQHKDSNFLPSSLIISWSPTHSFIDAEPTTSSPRFYEYVDRISFVNIRTDDVHFDFVDNNLSSVTKSSELSNLLVLKLLTTVVMVSNVFLRVFLRYSCVVFCWYN